MDATSIIPDDLLQARKFQILVDDFQGEAIWTKYKDRLIGFLDYFYDLPGCKRQFETTDNSFASLSPDIMHNIVERIDEPTELKNLVFVRGAWGEEAKKQKTNLESPEHRLSRFVVDKKKTIGTGWFERRWENLQRKAPNLYGKLCLEELCKCMGSGEPPYAQLRPVFHDLTLHHHRGKTPHSENMVEDLRAFLARQLQSPILRRLSISINVNLGLERELLAFCRSNQFEFLNWDCQPLSADFFLQIYNVFKNKRFSPDCKTRQINGFFHRSVMKDVMDTLRLKRLTNVQFGREDDCVVAKDWRLSIILSVDWDARVDVVIKLEHCEGAAKKIETTAEPPAKRQKIDDEDGPGEFNDCDYKDEDWAATDNYCCGNDELLPFLGEYEQYWTEEDCEDCDGCGHCATRM